MPYTTHTQQPIIGSSVDEQALAQAELNHHLETQAEAVAPTQDPLTSRDRRAASLARLFKSNPNQFVLSG